METLMKILKVRLCWAQIIEKVYEYIISNCETFFGVQNSDDLIFKIIPDDVEKTLIIALYHDDLEANFQNLIDNQNLRFTTTGYNKIIINSTCPIIKCSNSKKWLPDNEIRYLNYRYNEVVSLSFNIILQMQKLKKYHAYITYDNDIINYYFSKQFFNLADLNKTHIKILDISHDITNKFL